MIMEIIVGSIGAAFIVLVVFAAMGLQRLRKVLKKADHTLSEAQHVLRSLGEPIDNTNKLVQDIKKKSEALDLLFGPLYRLSKERPHGHSRFEKIGDLLEHVAEGIELFGKFKKDIKR